MQTVLLYLAALGAGVCVAVQQVLNGSLRISLQSPAWAGFASYLGGLLTMVVVLLAMREQMPSWKLVTATPWWAWSGGVLGGIFILWSSCCCPRWARRRCWRWWLQARCQPPSSWTISARSD